MKIKQKSDGNFKLTLSPFELTIIQTVMMKIRLGSGNQADAVLDIIEGIGSHIPSEDLFLVGVDVELDPRYGIDFTMNLDKSRL